MDLRYILVIIFESEYTASLLTETHVFLLHYFDLLPDFLGVVLYTDFVVNDAEEMSVWLVTFFCLPFNMK